MTETDRHAGVQRRECLMTSINPRAQHDYLVDFEGIIGNDGVRLLIRYVPDRAIIDAGSFAGYLATLATWQWPAPEALAMAVLDDVNNQLIPRWVQVRVTVRPRNGLPSCHRIVVEDRQPGWDNAEIVSRIALL